LDKEDVKMVTMLVIEHIVFWGVVAYILMLGV